MATDPRETLEKIIAQGQAKGYVPQYGLVEQYPNLAITPEHAQLLITSGISQEVAEARMYISVTDGRFFMHDMYIPAWADRAPCVLIPVWDVTGQPSQCQIRPDEPRVDKNRVIKYESLPQSNLRLDVPPAVLSQLKDPNVLLYITEGARKADAAVSKGVACISLLGVWGFRGKNAKGGKTTLADWEAIALNERKIRIAFDSDSVSKSQVASALQRLKAFLQSRGAKVEIIYFPVGLDGQKVGLDDYLSAHHLAEMEELVKDETEEVVSDTTYKVVDNRFVLCRGEDVNPLCNFTAKIELEELRDDGLVSEPFYHITGTTSDKCVLPTITVPVEEFSRMLWVEEQWRTRVQVGAGRNTRDHLCAAIKTYSQNAPVRQSFTHTGWRKIDDQLVFLHSNGYLPENVVVDAHVSLAGPLASVSLERPTEERPDAKQLIETFLTLGPHQTIVPLLSAAFTAILGEFITVDFAIHLEGITGSYKSELAALIQGFYGKDFTARKLPANWSSTANALEYHSHAAKDIVYVIDDYAPQPGRHATEQLAQKAEVVFRGAGNQAGRARLTVDIKFRPQYFARGLILSTGEDAFQGQSLNARVLSLHLGPGDIKSDILTILQIWRDDGYFTQILYEYINWLANRSNEDLMKKYRKFRDEILLDHHLHKRNASAVAKLRVGWDIFCEFIKAEELKNVGKDAFLEILETQGTIQIEQDTTTICIEAIRSALSSGKVYMEILNDDGNDTRRKLYGYRIIDGNRVVLGTKIGYVNEDGVEFLDPTAVHENVWKWLGRSPSGIRSALFASGWISTTGKNRQYTTPVRVYGAVMRLYKLDKALFEGLPSQSELDIQMRDSTLADLKEKGY